MNYTEITDLAYDYADRSDADSLAQKDKLLRIVESKINHKLKVMEKEVALSIPIVAGTLNYAMPADFGGLRSIRWEDNGRHAPMKVLTPEVYDDEIDNPPHVLRNDPNSGQDIGYIIKEDRRIYISVDLESGDIKGTYLQRVPELTAVATTNWVSDDYPDCYVFGLTTEIASYVKNRESAAFWDARFKEALEDIKDDDFHQKWSGNPLQMRAV
jgi:hypothetical protein